MINESRLLCVFYRSMLGNWAIIFFSDCYFQYYISNIHNLFCVEMLLCIVLYFVQIQRQQLKEDSFWTSVNEEIHASSDFFTELEKIFGTGRG
jgi:hypothetical protein